LAYVLPKFSIFSPLNFDKNCHIVAYNRHFLFFSGIFLQNIFLHVSLIATYLLTCSGRVELCLLYRCRVWHTYTSVNFLSQSYFTFFIKSKAENQLKFKQCSRPAQRVRTSVKLRRRETPDGIIALNHWLLNISKFSPVDYRMLAMQQKWVCQHIIT